VNRAIYRLFNQELGIRLENDVYTNEDSVRYTFFGILVRDIHLALDHLVLEFPHETIRGAKIDAYFPDFQGKEVIIEFKYDRAIPSGSNSPRPQKAGMLFNDMKRLLAFKTSLPAMRLFIYLTDDEMIRYMRNPKNNLVNFVDLKPGNQLRVDGSFFENKSSTFKDAAGGVFTARMTCDWSEKLPKQHELRIFRVDK
jgi:hypothetical protein